jgi:hypothetical protein
MPVWTLEMTGTWWKMTTTTFFGRKQWASDPDWPDFQRNYSVVIHFRQKPHPKRPETASKWADAGLDSRNDRNLVENDNKNIFLTQTMGFRPLLA